VESVACTEIQQGLEMYYASFCQTNAVTGQDCEQYTVCRDCITLPQCTWCSDNTVSPAGLGKDRCCCGFLMYIDNEYNPLIGPNLAEYFVWYPAGWFPIQL